jgi:hypothetical protein
MLSHLTSIRFDKLFVSIGLMLSFAFVAQTCSTGNPNVELDPDNAGKGSGGGSGGGGNPGANDGDPSLPSDGALVLSGAPTVVSASPQLGVDVDVQAPISIWFSESMNESSVTSSSFVLRDIDNPIIPVSTSRTWLMEGRLLILNPNFPLSTATEYEVVANPGPLDLDGIAYQPPTNGRVLRFTTASQPSGIAPKVMATYPDQGSVNQPNDHECVVVFSKSVDYTSISSAISFSNQTTFIAADYDTTLPNSARHVSDKVFSFAHEDDSVDLGSSLQVDISTSVTDIEFTPLSLSAPYLATWSTLSFSRPDALTFDSLDFGVFNPAINLNNYTDFPITAELGITALPTDIVVLRANEGVNVAESQAPVGLGTVPFILDFSNDLGGSIFNSDTQVLFSAFVERGNLRTTIKTYRNNLDETDFVAHDLVRPFLLNFGPPVGTFAGQFLCEQSFVRPYGLANEEIGQTTITFDSLTLPPRNVPALSGDSSFISSGFDPSLTTINEGPVDFEIEVVDAAGNAALSTVQGSVKFFGFVGGTDLATSGGNLRVVAYDAKNKFALSGATVHIEDFGGANPDFALSSSDGSVTFSGRIGPQTLTIQIPGWNAVSLVGVDSSEVSLPLQSSIPVVGSLNPQVQNINTGVLTLSSNTLVQSDAAVDPSLTQEYDLDAIFGSSLQGDINRLNWFSGFHEVEDFPAANRYFRFVGLDSRVLTRPSILGDIVVPTLELAESTNSLTSSTDFIYPLEISAGTGIASIANSGSLITSTIPGVFGRLAVGIGSVNLGGGGVNGAAELEINLLNEVVNEGASASDIQVSVYAEGVSGNKALAIVEEAVAASPGNVAVNMPNIPLMTSPWGGASYPFSRDFTDTLAGLSGIYHFTLLDTSASFGRWDIYVSSSSSAGVLTLPTLLDSAVDVSPEIPINNDPGVQWFAVCQAFEMPLSFDESSFFFSSLYQDSISWALAAQSPALGF